MASIFRPINQSINKASRQVSKAVTQTTNKAINLADRVINGSNSLPPNVQAY